jgi:phage shock protein PspC (stress-responsive transcriptional regulator)
MGLVDDLERLAQLHGAGGLTDDEFAAAKERLLAGGTAPPCGDPASRLQQFRRIEQGHWLGGVCTGLGAATRLPVGLFRAAFAALTPMAGVGAALYGWLWLLTPVGPIKESSGEIPQSPTGWE